MQSDTPEGDPRLKRTNPGPKVATGYVDPCLVYLERKRADKKPEVLVCFAATSRELVESGKSPSLELQDVLVMRCKPRAQGKGRWTFELRPEKLLTLEKGALVGVPPASYALPPKLSRQPVLVGKQAIRYLDQKTAAALRKKFGSSRSPNYPRTQLAKRVLEFAAVDWPSIRQIVSFIDKGEPQRPRLPFVRQLISALKKKFIHT